MDIDTSTGKDGKICIDASEIAKKREKEKRTVGFMIEIYCHRKHKTKGSDLCDECRELTEYAFARVDHCPHIATKTFCSSCKTHCYNPEMREKIRSVMRFSGPRMVIYCPKLFFKHKIDSSK